MLCSQSKARLDLGEAISLPRVTLGTMTDRHERLDRTFHAFLYGTLGDCLDRLQMPTIILTF